ncbi:MAG: right-handed parallel beta-helix repeat-containing protein [Dehalococcoidia bacterium]|nr:right-handed parallel beta-helix repeat-containing protein [Dehalococcoidia bacterium]
MKKGRVAIGVLLAVVLTLFAFPMAASAQNTWHVSKWTKYEGNPVLNPGPAGEWDAAIGDAAVLYDGTTYHMWYAGHNTLIGHIGYATSPDGITWIKYNDPATTTPYAESDPVLNPGSAGEWDVFWVYSPAVLYDGTSYRMWYGGDGGAGCSIGYSISPDGINWTKYDDLATTTPYAESDPVLNRGSAGEWDDAYLFNLDVLYDGTYHMWYSGSADSIYGRIGYATSPDGITWGKYDDPITTASPYAESDPVVNPSPAGEWDDVDVRSGTVVYDGATYHMWYSGRDGTSRIGYATNSYIDADFLSIQNAIEFADPDDTILVHPGKYDEKLLINKSLTLQSTGGWENTTIDPVTDSVIQIQNPVEVTVQDFEIRGGSWGIHVGSAEKKVNILDCFIQGSAADGIYVAGGGDLLNIERNIISGNIACGIYIEQAWSTVNIEENTIGGVVLTWPEEELFLPGNSGDGICIDDVPAGADVAVEDNDIGGNGDDGVDLASGSSVAGSVNIKNNVIAWALGKADPFGPFIRISNADDGIHIGEVSDTGSITIEDNKISENGDDGIDFGQGAGAVFGGVDINSNFIGGWTCYPEAPGTPVRYYGNGGEGIYIFQVGDTGIVNIESNKISENALVEEDTGIYIQNIYGAVSVAGNDIGAWEDAHGETYLGNEGQGIFVVDVFSGAELNIGPDNSIRENTSHGIDVAYGQETATIEIHHNFIDDPVVDGCGVKLGSGGVCGATISNNTIVNNYKGIHLDENSRNNIIQDNEIRDNAEGIWIEGDDNEVWGNDILNNAGAAPSGVHLTSTAGGNVIHCNNIAGNDPYGVCNENADEEVNATYNWWGCSEGPGVAGCDTASAYVAYTPWLTAPGPDGDLDLLTCRGELERGTDPNDPDTDGGGVKDGVEVARGTDPLESADDAPPHPIGVGGEAQPVNKLAILAPWIVLAVAIIAGAAIVVRRRRTQE